MHTSEKKGGGRVIGEDVFQGWCTICFFQPEQLNNQNAPPIFFDFVTTHNDILHLHPVFDYVLWFSLSWPLGAWMAVWGLPQGLVYNLFVQFFHPKQPNNKKKSSPIFLIV